MRNLWGNSVVWLEAHSRWNQLKTLGSSNLVRASVLMPAFGYMLLLNEQVHHYLTIRYDGWLVEHLHLSNVWRIWLLFYGSFFLAAATILYSRYCPDEIKRYSTSFEMAELEGKYQLSLGQMAQVQKNVKGAYQLVPDALAKRIGFVKKDVDHPQQFGTDWPTRMSGWLVHQWTALNLSRQYLRIAIYLLYSIGLGLIAIPAAITFLQVTSLPVKHLFQ